MKILIVNKFLYPNGGSETYIFNLGTELEKRGHEVQYFGMEHEGRTVGNRVNSYTEDMEFHGTNRPNTEWTDKVLCKVGGPAKKLSYPFKIIYSKDARRKIRAVLEDFHPEVVHLNNINFQITPSIIDEIRAFDASVRIVYTAHDSQWVCPNHLLRIPSNSKLCDAACARDNYQSCVTNKCIHNSRLRSVLGAEEGRFYSRRGTYKQVDMIICPSSFMENILSRNPAINGRTVVIHNFLSIDYEQAANKVTIPEGLKDHTGRQLPDKYVLYYGRFSEEKGISTLVQAVQKMSDITFVFVGKESEKAFENYGDAGNKTMPANVFPISFLTGDTLRAVIQKAVVTIHPSICYENCPFTVMESQVYGTPVIASRVGGIPELVEEGKTGDLFECGNAEALAECIRKAWQDPARMQEYRTHCPEWSSETFPDINLYMQKLITIYTGK